MSNKYLDKEGLVELWSKIKNTFTTQEQVQSTVDTAIDNVIDGAPQTFDTLKKIADWINAQSGDASITEMIEERKNIILPVSAYGFDTNLRINQTVNGSSLVDEVLLQTNDRHRQVIIKTGDYKYNVASILESNDYRGFSIINMDLNPTDSNPIPALEKGVFLYSVGVNKTFTFYEKAYTNAEIQSQIESILASTMIPISNDEIDTICQSEN